MINDVCREGLTEDSTKCIIPEEISTTVLVSYLGKSWSGISPAEHHTYAEARKWGIIFVFGIRRRISGGKMYMGMLHCSE